jgi:Tfp pilus assembly protein PilN
MRAVNLIPGDSRRGGSGGVSSLPGAPTALLLGLLIVALGSVTAYVLTSNTISQRKSEIVTAQAQLAAAQAQVAQFSHYKSFAGLAQARAQTVIEIAGGRFDWEGALADLSQVVPRNTSLQSLLGTVSPDVSVSSSGGASTSGAASALRSAIAAPAFELTGCTKSQDDVARLMSRLRLINGVTRVTLGDSTKPDGAVTSSASSGSCGANAPAFDLVVFFKPLPGGGAAGTSVATAGPASAAPAGTTAPSGTTSTAPAGSTTTSTPAPTTSTAAPTTSTTPSTVTPSSQGSGSGAAK